MSTEQATNTTVGSKESAHKISRPKESCVTVESTDKPRVKRNEVRGPAVKSREPLVARIVGLAMNLIPVAMVVVGGCKWHNCPRETMIPIWLVVTGVLWIVSSFIDVVVCFKRETFRPTAIRLVDHIIVALMIIWLIPGSVWVYESYWNVSYDEKSPFYCDKVTYLIAFVAITATYSFLAVVTLLLMIIGVVVAFLG